MLPAPLIINIGSALCTLPLWRHNNTSWKRRKVMIKNESWILVLSISSELMILFQVLAVAIFMHMHEYFISTFCFGLANTKHTREEKNQKLEIFL